MAKKWSGVSVSMQSALATALTLTGITKANPGVASYTGTDPSDGDFLYLQVNGMHQLDERVIRADDVVGGSDTFELEGEDTTLYESFSSGTAQVITFGTGLTDMTNINVSGGDFDFVDVTTIHDLVRKQIPGLPNPITFSFENIWDISDAGQAAMLLASKNQQKRAFKFTFQDGTIMTFTGYVGFTGMPTGAALDVVKSPAVITMFGNPTFYAGS